MEVIINSTDSTYGNLRDELLTKPVRKYSSQGTLLTILACINATNPRGIFYRLEVKNPKGETSPTTRDAAFKMVDYLLAHDPITNEQYRITETKLCYELHQRQRRLYSENIAKTVKYVEEKTDNDSCFGGMFGMYCGNY